MANDKKFVVKNGLQTQNISFVDSSGNTITTSMLSTDTLSFSGDSGQLFSITDSLSGTIFAVNDISGVPSIEVDDDGTIRFAETFGNVLIGTSVDDGTNKLQVAGNIYTSNNLIVDGDLVINGTTTTVNTATLQVEDNNIVLNYGTGDTTSTADGAGITIQDAVNASTNATILWTASTDTFAFSHAITAPGYNNTNWDTAYGWGNHADAGYLTSQTAEVNDLTASVTWANVPDINITQSSVTQHQAALSITESQISNLGAYIELGDLSVTTNAASGGGALSYASGTGIFSYTPPDLSGYLTSETSHADVLVDGDFANNGLMKRTGVGTYTTITDSSANWDTAYGWGDHSTAGYLTSETSHADVLVDGDFTSAGFMKRGATAGTYSVDTNTYITSAGTNFTNTLGIHKTSPTFTINDTDATNATEQTGWISFQRQGSEKAWIGYGSSSNANFTIKNTEGSVTVDSALVVNGTATVSNLTLANPGIGSTSTINFAKTSDTAQIRVTESVADATEFQFYMADNPSTASDKFNWYMNSWQGEGSAWKPLEFSAYDTRINSVDTIFNGNLYIGNQPYISTGGVIGSVVEVKTGTLSLTADVSNFTGSQTHVYIELTTDGTTFTAYNRKSTSGRTAYVTDVAITGTAQTITQGITVTFSGTTGGVVGDNWEFGAWGAGIVDISTQLKVDTIVEHTADAGVTLEGTVLKDSLVGIDIGANAISTVNNTRLHVGNVDNTQTSIQIRSAANGNGYLLFADGDSASAYVGNIRYDHSGNIMSFTTGGTQRVRITSAGIDARTGGFLINGTEVIDSSRNLTNIGTINGSTIANWDTAYGWGDHSTAGYLTAETNDLSAAVTWADVPDANITSSSVTQHLGDYSTTTQIANNYAKGKYQAWTALTGSSGDWFPLFQIGDANQGGAIVTLKTYAHTSVTFAVGEGYSTSDKSSISILNSTINDNSAFAGVDGLRIKRTGVVEAQLSWASGPTVNIEMQIVGPNANSVTVYTTLETAVDTEVVVDTVSTSPNGLMRSLVLEAKSSVRLNGTEVINSSGNWVGGGNISEFTNDSGYLTSETSHADVLVDGDFTSAGFMKTDGSGVYSVDSNTYLTTTGKAADSDKLDGIDSTSFLRSDADDSFSGKLTGTGQTPLVFASGAEGSHYTPTEGGVGTARYWLRFDVTDDASYPFLTNRTPSGDVVIKTGTAAGGAEVERIRFKGGDGTQDIEISNARLGIGTATVNKDLQVNFNNNDTTVTSGNGLAGGVAGDGLLIYNENTTTGVYANLDFRAGNADARIAYKYSGTTNVGDFHFITDNAGTPKSSLVIKDAGNINIPSGALQFNDTTVIDSSRNVTNVESVNLDYDKALYLGNTTDGRASIRYGDFSSGTNFFVLSFSNGSTSNPAGAVFQLSGTNLLINNGLSTKITLNSNTGAGTFTGPVTGSNLNISNWDTAYTYSQVGHLPLSGGTLTGNLNGTVAIMSSRVQADEIRCNTAQQLVLNAGESSAYATGQAGEVVYLNAEGGLQVNSSPDNWTSLWAGRKTATICASDGSSSFPGNVSVNGLLSATTKSFIIDHPTKEGMKLRYGSLEGPENGVYVRGKLEKRNVIELPDYWTGLVDENTITVQLTAVGKPKNLYVAKIENNTVVVKNASWFSNNTECFYTVYAERKDVEKLMVEY